MSNNKLVVTASNARIFQVHCKTENLSHFKWGCPCAGIFLKELLDSQKNNLMPKALQKQHGMLRQVRSNPSLVKKRPNELEVGFMVFTSDPEWLKGKAATSTFSHQEHSSSVPLAFYIKKCIEYTDMRVFPSPDDISIVFCLLPSSFETLAFFWQGSVTVWTSNSAWKRVTRRYHSRVPPLYLLKKSVKTLPFPIKWQVTRMLFTPRVGQLLLQSEGSRSPWRST